MSETNLEVRPVAGGRVVLYVQHLTFEGAVEMSPAYARELAARLQQAADAAEDAS